MEQIEQDTDGNQRSLKDDGNHNSFTDDQPDTFSGFVDDDSDDESNAFIHYIPRLIITLLSW